ncbi:MAG: prepilin-type N-terminal cleavage/methylation domain-containing protein [Deltaproteobacteria bacterium]|nr:prepilin-type N-terminal cleavage/methylation domain-containing protein [Deltaproteobacteria bacterium]
MKRCTKRKAQAGITMLEVMIAVAVVGILVKLALPSLAGSSRKVKGDTEVNAFMTELRMKQEQFHLENGRYLSTGTESTMFPATAQPQQLAITTMPAEWNQLRVNLPEAQARCQYVAIAGNKLSGTIGTVAASFGFSNPGRDWYYILAHCDLDGDATVDSWYFTSSKDAAIQKLNPGR